MLTIIVHAHPHYFPVKEHIREFFDILPDAQIYFFHPEFSDQEDFSSLSIDFPNLIVLPMDGYAEVSQLPTPIVIYELAAEAKGALNYIWNYYVRGDDIWYIEKNTGGNPIDFYDLISKVDCNGQINLPKFNLYGENLEVSAELGPATLENIRNFVLDMVTIAEDNDSCAFDKAKMKLRADLLEKLRYNQKEPVITEWLLRFLHDNNIPFNGDLEQVKTYLNRTKLGIPPKKPPSKELEIEDMPELSINYEEEYRC